MLPAGDVIMDCLHPPMLLQDEENLFNQYLHPPMLPAEDKSTNNNNNSMQPHSPMFQNDYSGNGTGAIEFYDTSMHNF